MRGERQDNGSGVSGADICFRYYSYMYAMYICHESDFIRRSCKQRIRTDNI